MSTNALVTKLKQLDQYIIALTKRIDDMESKITNIDSNDNKTIDTMKDMVLETIINETQNVKRDVQKSLKTEVSIIETKIDEKINRKLTEALQD